MFKRLINFLLTCLFRPLHRQMASVFTELRSLRQALENARPVFVLVTSPNGCMMGQRVFPTRGYEQRITFSPMMPLPAGVFISLVGDGAVITDVTVGKMAQLLSFPSELPICITRDPCESGSQIRVGIKGVQ